MESRRQKKVAALIQKDMSAIFQKHGPGYYGKAFVTITQVRVTPDMSIARSYLSIYNVEKPEETLTAIRSNAGDIRRHLGNMIGKQVRKVPELEFFIDDTLDQVFRMEEIFRELHKGDKKEKEGDE